MKKYKLIVIATFLLGNLFISATIFAQARKTMPINNSILNMRVKMVDSITMQHIYNEVKTPFKYGIVIKADSLNDVADCPSIFRYRNHWYMMYVQLLKPTVGYQTYLAKSDDLLHWEKLGKILSFTNDTSWDAWQADGGISLCDYRWNGTHKLGKYDGKYWLSYIGGAQKGYETDPLSIGVAWTKNLAEITEWNRVPQNPVLSSKQADVRHFEKLTLYKSQIIHDKSKSLG